MSKTETNSDINSQIGNFFVSPKEIFCGDNVLLQSQIEVSDEMAASLSEILPVSSKDINEISKLIKTDSLQCTIQEVNLSISGNVINSEINCVCWEPGEVALPSIWLKTSSGRVEIPVPKFYVSSILEVTGETSLRPSLGPMVLPGTTYFVFGGVFIIILLLSLIIVLCAKSKKIARGIKNFIITRRFKKNYKKTLQELKKLLKSSENLTNIDFAKELQSIMRKYFAFRFSDRIFNLTTSEIITWFNSVYNLILPESAEEAVMLFYELMLRCDFIRFSGNTVSGADLQSDERPLLVEKASKIMELIEKGYVGEKDA